MDFNLKVNNNSVVFVAFSSNNLKHRFSISKYVLGKDCVPINGMLLFESMFYIGLVDKYSVQNANNDLIVRSDELWVFGSVSDGVLGEIFLAKKHGKKIKYFDISQIGEGDVVEIDKQDVDFEKEVSEYRGEI